MEALDNVIESLTIASPFLIWLFIALSVRICIDAVLRFPATSAHYPALLYVLDLLIVIWVAISFAILALTHWLARRRDDVIWAASRDFESEAKTLAETSKMSSLPEAPAAGLPRWELVLRRNGEKKIHVTG